jgi:hypothetical protein
MDQQDIRKLIKEGKAHFPGENKAGANFFKKNKNTDCPKRKNEEEQLQRACHDWNVKQQKLFPILEWIFHCPNGGGRSKAESGVLKVMGTQKGVPDFMLPFPSGEYKGLGIELKSPIGVLSSDQRRWLKKSLSEGWCVAVLRDLNHYIEVIEEFDRGVKNDILYGHNEIFKISKRKSKINLSGN